MQAESEVIVRKQVDSVEFGFYTDKDVRDRSVVEIVSSQTFDPNNNPLMGGLCDPRMGPGSNEDPPCSTCGLRCQYCPGHFGHIELAVPVHHPLMVNDILSILRTKCLACHKLRAPPRQLAEFRAKFNLLYKGEIGKLHSLDDEMEIALAKGIRENEETPTKIKKSTMEGARILDKFLAQHQPQRSDPTDSTQSTERHQRKAERKLNSYEHKIRAELVKQCISSCRSAKHCGHCGGFSPTIRQDSSNKFFRGIVAEKFKRLNTHNGVKIRSALQEGGESDDDDKMKVDSEENHAEFDDSDNEDDSDSGDGPENSTKKDHFMHGKEVQAQLRRTWEQEPYLMNCLFGFGNNFGVDGYSVYFLQAVPVPPNRFRPSMETSGMVVQHAQNEYLSKIIELNETLRELFADGKEPLAYTAWINLQTAVNCFMDSSKDTSGLPPEKVTPGIRQLLERKEGLFRKNMMGKRVDYACRSVISPDPYVGTNEIGLPKYFAEVLTYPTPVTSVNIDEMRELVVRGPAEYPGARWVETNGRRIDLTRMKKHSRIAIGARLLAGIKSSGKPAIVGRQLRDGDYVLMNRQPTLHKPGIMAHKVRVLHSQKQKTIRMHYANCNTYNADFDGDEMNCHFPQNDLAQAEAYYIARTNLQYIVPTDGSPLRGLIQDHVVGGVKLTKRDTFLERWEYQQLVYSSLASLPGLEVIRDDAVIELMPPAVIKPRPLWTGKQVVTTLLRHLQKGNDQDDERNSNFEGISLERKAKTPGSAFGDCAEEHLVLVRDGELLRGVLDKSAFGATDFSLVHSVYEAYGPEKAGLLLNALSRLFTVYIQCYAGHSCRTEDLILTKDADEERRNLVQRAYNLGTRAAKAWADSEGGKVQIPPIPESASQEPLKPVEIASASAKIGELLQGNEGKENFAALDGYMQGQLNPLASDIVKKALPSGLVVPFPHNSFGIMTTTGAKGSIVNQSQVICSLGQQALEGRRVPRLSSGRTLPSFAPYDPRPRADGFVMDRFLTGVRPQEYYFHCMAGREGLVDTAVKTSRSGYLQRCLVKHLEELKICYDYSVRNAEGGVVQFVYGEDGLDPTKASYLDCSSTSLKFIARNHTSVSRHNLSLPHSTLDISADDALRHESILGGNDGELLEVGAKVKARKLRDGAMWKRGSLCLGWFDAIVTKVRNGGKSVDLEYVSDRSRAAKVPIKVDLGQRDGGHDQAQVAATVATLVKPCSFDPIMCSPERGHLLGSSGACLSERVASHAAKQMKTNLDLQSAMKSADLSPEAFGKLVSAKYSASLCAPGEAVGSIAAQSIGEPSTQMTLNTFHLAGSGANVTLGIPRLREIIMTASRQLKTPTMSVPLNKTVDDRAALKLSRKYTKLTLQEVISGNRGVTVTESLEMEPSGDWNRVYHVKIKLHPAERIHEAFGLSIHDIARVVAENFVPLLSKLMTNELRRSKVDGDGSSTDVEGGEKQEYMESLNAADAKRSRPAMDDLSEEEDDDDDNDDVNAEDGADAERARRRTTQDVAYEEESDVEDDQNPASQYLNDEAGEFDLPSATPEHGRLRVDMKSNTILLSPLKTDPASRPLLMAGLVEKASKKTVVYSREKIDQAFVNEEDGRGRCLQTAGVNFEELWNLDVVDHDRLLSNDIWAIRCAYGVEAARNNIVEQIRSVFGVYGIEVDPRHLSLIADYMTYEGEFKPMSRIGMKETSSAFLQMSFETTANFLKQACMVKDTETMMSPSANIVLGRPVKHGTGLMDILAA